MAYRIPHPLELFDLRPDQGRIHLSRGRFLLQSAVGMQILRREVVAALGDRARGLLFRHGYAEGYFDALCQAERVRALPLAERFRYGADMHRLQGLVSVEVLRAESDGHAVHIEATLSDGWEAEDHVRAWGPSPSPVCWSMTGYASGFASGASELDVLFRELECVATGAPRCRIVGHTAAEWADPALLQEACGGLDQRTLEAVRAEVRSLVDAAPICEPPAVSGLLELGGAGNALARRHSFVVRSRRISELLARAERVAPTDMNVLVQGESGTGKEFFAHFLHERSPRAAEPFVVVNCAALGEHLLESELFGHAKGAFTGAIREKVGLFEAAGRGTLFLDEIGELTPAMQAKLLRALENREIRRVGGERSIRVAARVVAATHRDLRRSVEEGRFREDLWFRIGAFVLEVPPLRDRPEDVAPLAHLFLHDTAARLDKPVHSIAADAMTRLLRHGWPGNVRELRHAVEQATLLAAGPVITAADLPASVGAAPPRPEPGCLDVREHERALIEEALRRFGGNRTRAAEALRMSPVTLWRKLKRLGLR